MIPRFVEHVLGTPALLNWVQQRHIRDEVQSVSAIVVVIDDERENKAILENERLGLLRIPPGPRDPEAILAVRVKVIGEPNNIVHYFTVRERVREVSCVSLEERHQRFSVHWRIGDYTHGSDVR
jgi:hypothetical protein